MYSSKVGYELVANCCRSVNVECLLTKIKRLYTINAVMELFRSMNILCEILSGRWIDVKEKLLCIVTEFYYYIYFVANLETTPLIIYTSFEGRLLTLPSKSCQLTNKYFNPPRFHLRPELSDLFQWEQLYKVEMHTNNKSTTSINNFPLFNELKVLKIYIMKSIVCYQLHL